MGSNATKETLYGCSHCCCPASQSSGLLMGMRTPGTLTIEGLCDLWFLVECSQTSQYEHRAVYVQTRKRPTPMHFCPQISYHHRTRRPRNPQKVDVLHGANRNILASAPPWHGTERCTPLWVESTPSGAVDKTFHIPSPHFPFSSPLLPSYNYLEPSTYLLL